MWYGMIGLTLGEGIHGIVWYGHGMVWEGIEGYVGSIWY